MNNIFVLSDQEKKEIDELQKSLIQYDPFKDMISFLSMASLLSKQLPESLKTHLHKLRNGTLKNDILVIKNLPLPDAIATPRNNKSSIGETTNIARCQAIINQYLGEMVAYEAEGNGHLFQDMVPNESLKNTQTSLGSSTELELHTEQAFSKLKPDYLSLACIKGDSTAKTYYYHVNNILNNISFDSLMLLGEDLWTIGVDLSFTMNGCKEKRRGPLPIYKNGNLIFDQDLMEGIDEESESIKQEIIGLYIKHRNHIVLEEGNLLIMNNNKLVHGRSSFFPNFNEHDRFVIRTFIQNDLGKVQDYFQEHTRIIQKESS
jgi:L-asparagine oxygenase